MSAEKSKEKEKSEKKSEIKQNLFEKSNNFQSNTKLQNDSFEKKQNQNSQKEKTNIIQKQESFNINNSLLKTSTTFSYLNSKRNIFDNNSVYLNTKKRSFSSLNIFEQNNYKKTNIRNFCEINFQRQKTPKLIKYDIDYRFEGVNNKPYYYPKNNKINFVSFNKPGSSLYLKLKRSNETNKLIYMNKNTNYNFYDKYKKSNKDNETSFKNNYYFEYSNNEEII